MLKNLDEFIRLQELDKSIKKISIEKINIPKILEASQKKVQDEIQKLDSIKKMLTEKQLEKKNLELELASIEEAIKKQNIEINSVKSNDRYKAIIEIIQNEKQKKSDIEDKILTDFDDLDSYNSMLEKQKILIKEVENELDLKKIELEKIDKDLELQINVLSKERESIVKILNDENLMKIYEKIRAHQNGIGISKIDMETYSCCECNMHLPFQKVNDVISSSNPVLCETCNRILYVLDKDNI